MKNPVAIVKDAVKDLLTGAHEVYNALHATDNALRHEHDSLVAERARLVGSRPPRSELIAAADAAVDAVAATWAADQGPRLVAALAGSVDLAPDDTVRGLVGGSLWPALVGQDPAQLVAALWPEQIKQGLRRVLSATAYVEGPPMAERPRLIAALDAKIRDAEERHRQFVAQAPPGITLEHLPITAGRHRHAAQALERWERDGIANAAYYRKHPDARPPKPEVAP